MRKRLTASQNQSEIDILRSLRKALDKESREIHLLTYICLVWSSDKSVAQSLSLYAEKNTLEYVLKDIDSQRDSPFGACLEQMVNIAGAIEFLHRVQTTGEQGSCYCHLDLKPANIVVFQDAQSPNAVGIWKVIDFGISKVRKPAGFPPHLKDKTQVTVTVSTTTKQLGGTYQPPEVNQQNEKRMGRRSDVWSLGCIFTEVLVAQLGSAGTLKKFRDNMKAGLRDRSCLPNVGEYFFYEKHREIRCPPFIPILKLNEAFRSELEHISRQTQIRGMPECKKLISKMVVMKRTKRLKSKCVLKELKLIQEQVTTNTNINH